MNDYYSNIPWYLCMVHSQAASLYNYTSLLFTAQSQQNCCEQAPEMIHARGPATEEKCESVRETERKNPGRLLMIHPLV